MVAGGPGRNPGEPSGGHLLEFFGYPERTVFAINQEELAVRMPAFLDVADQLDQLKGRSQVKRAALEA
jgi:hypothetical protein